MDELMSLMLKPNQVQPDWFPLPRLLRKLFNSPIYLKLLVITHFQSLKLLLNTALAKIRNEGVTEFHITFVIEHGLTANNNNLM